jgi:parvulin-like peptidyl-prolyl isomerase
MNAVKMNARRQGRALLMLAAVLPLIWVAAAAKDKKDEAAASPVVAKVNGDDVTKSEIDSMLKGNERFFDLTSQKTRDLLHGKPLADYLFKKEIVEVRAVALKNASDLPQMKETIGKAYERLKAGEDFATVAKEMSQEASSAEKGGDLGDPQTFFDWVHPFNRTALTLKEGQFSEPILTIFGYHIVKVDKIIPPMEGKPKRVKVRHILIRYPAATPDWREVVDRTTKEAQVEVVDKSYCKKIPSYCGDAAGS